MLRIAVEHRLDLLEDRIVGRGQGRDRRLSGKRYALRLRQIGAGFVAKEEFYELPSFLLVLRFRGDGKPAARPLIAAGLVAPCRRIGDADAGADLLRNRPFERAAPHSGDLAAGEILAELRPG